MALLISLGCLLSIVAGRLDSIPLHLAALALLGTAAVIGWRRHRRTRHLLPAWLRWLP